MSPVSEMRLAGSVIAGLPATSTEIFRIIPDRKRLLWCEKSAVPFPAETGIAAPFVGTISFAIVQNDSGLRSGADE
jgi:hypothetical protein